MPDPKRRFSKSALLVYIDMRIDQIQRTWHFDNGNGTAQLAKYKEPSMITFQGACLAYGEKEALQRMVEEFELKGRS